MNNGAFRFKQFRVSQHRCAMKLGMDACVFGAWVNSADSFLDVGTGTGILSLMTAQRFPNAIIDAVEIDKNAAEQALENFTDSAWKHRLNVINSDFLTCDFQRKYSHIISNPPYFSESLKSENDLRNQARHDDTLNLVSFFEKSKGILHSGGLLSLIMPADDKRLPGIALEQGFYVHRKCSILPHQNKQAVRIMWEFGLAFFDFESSELVLENPENRRLTIEGWKLLKDFYFEL